jgi:hypothetical protein
MFSLTPRYRCLRQLEVQRPEQYSRYTVRVRCYVRQVVEETMLVCVLLGRMVSDMAINLLGIGR